MVVFYTVLQAFAVDHELKLLASFTAFFCVHHEASHICVSFCIRMHYFSYFGQSIERSALHPDALSMKAEMSKAAYLMSYCYYLRSRGPSQLVPTGSPHPLVILSATCTILGFRPTRIAHYFHSRPLYKHT